jgi:hypothetical protein
MIYTLTRRVSIGFVVVSLVASSISGLFGIAPVKATTPLQVVSPAQDAQLISDTLSLAWNDVGASSYDVAVGSSQGLPDYAWRGGLTGTSVTISNLPTDGSRMYIRIFANGGTGGLSVDSVVRAFDATAPTPESNPMTTPTPSPTPSNLPSGFLSLTPAPGSTLSGSSVTFQWSHETYQQLDIAVGSGLGEADYAWIAGAVNQATVSSFPTDGSQIYVRLFPGGDGHPSVDVLYTASKSTPPSLPEPVPPPLTTLPVPLVTGGSLSAIWANTGEDKVTQSERRSSSGVDVRNSAWNGVSITVAGAKNEVVAFNTVLEANNVSAKNVSFTFDTLIGPGGTTIATKSSDVFDWANRPIENFFVRYLEIKGLSALSYQTYDERHIPDRLQRPSDSNGIGTGTWTDRPDHNAFYPDIAVPLELEPTFDIAKGQNQSIWTDIYIPKTTVAGTYTGTVTVRENGVGVAHIPVHLTVHNFTLPDDPSADTMLFFSRENVNERYLGERWIWEGLSQWDNAVAIRDHHFQLAHRHKISLIDADETTTDHPSNEWLPRLNGSLFTSVNGYDGPGVGVGNGVYSIGTYGTWNWKSEGEVGMHTRTNAWEQWFREYSPSTERFVYLVDEPTDFTEINTWTTWMKNNPGVGKHLKSFSTVSARESVLGAPNLDIHASWANIGPTTAWQQAIDTLTTSPTKDAYMYNGKRPAVGSFATEDDGIALRALVWAQYKKQIDRWFFWESTYYNNYQGGAGQTNVFQTAHTFGTNSSVDPIRGESGWNYSNGDGVLFYPGTDTVFPTESYGVNGPIASLRLKFWRRGIQDVDYLALASKVDPVRTQQIVNNLVPKALWEYGVTDPSDPTYVRTDISWSTDPDVWEQARAELASIIQGGTAVEPPPVVNPPTEPETPPVVQVQYENGTLIKYKGNSAVYQIQSHPLDATHQVKRHIVDAKTFKALGFKWKDVVVVVKSVVYENGEDITYQNMGTEVYRKNGTLITYPQNPAVYILAPDPTDSTRQVKRHIKSAKIFKAHGWKWSDIVTIPNAEVYVTGEPVSV